MVVRADPSSWYLLHGLRGCMDLWNRSEHAVRVVPGPCSLWSAGAVTVVEPAGGAGAKFAPLTGSNVRRLDIGKR